MKHPETNKERSRTKRCELISALNESIRTFQQASGFGLRSYGKGVTETLRTHILAVVCGEPGCSMDRVIEVLDIPQPTASRAVKQLQNEGLLRVSRSQIDARTAELSATPEGINAHFLFNQELAGIYSNLLAALTIKERDELFVLQGRLADGLGAAHCYHSKEVHSMQRHVARITRGLKLLRTDIYKEHSISILGWLFLRMISLHAGKLSGKDLCIKFSAPMTTVSSVIIALNKSRLISRTLDKDDHRVHKLTITTKGLRLLEEISGQQEQVLVKATEHFTDDQLSRLVSLTERYLSSFSPGDSPSEFLPQFTIQLLTSQKDTSDLTRLLDAHSSGKRKFSFSRGMESYAVGLFADGILKGGGIVTVHGRQYVMEAIYLPIQIASDPLTARFTEQSIALIKAAKKPK